MILVFWHAYDAVVTIRLAEDGPRVVGAETIGAAWLAVAGRILDAGVESRYDGLAVREVSLVTLVVERPDPADESRIPTAAISAGTWPGSSGSRRGGW